MRLMKEQASQCQTRWPGVNVIAKIFWDFRQFLATK
jgi:hypothetical protein